MKPLADTFYYFWALWAGFIAGIVIIYIIVVAWKRRANKDAKHYLLADALEWLQELPEGIRTDRWTPPEDLLPAFYQETIIVDLQNSPSDITDSSRVYERVRYILKQDEDSALGLGTDKAFFVIENNVVAKVVLPPHLKKKL